MDKENKDIAFNVYQFNLLLKEFNDLIFKLFVIMNYVQVNLRSLFAPHYKCKHVESIGMQFLLSFLGRKNPKELHLPG